MFFVRYRMDRLIDTYTKLALAIMLARTLLQSETTVELSDRDGRTTQLLTFSSLVQPPLLMSLTEQT